MLPNPNTVLTRTQLGMAEPGFEPDLPTAIVTLHGRSVVKLDWHKYIEFQSFFEVCLRVIEVALVVLKNYRNNPTQKGYSKT